MKRITRLFVFPLCLLFGLPVQANNDRPMFMRATLLEAEGIEGPFDATIYIQVVHRSPSWFPNQDISLGQITLGEPSPWVDLSQHLAANTDSVTTMLTVAADGEKITSPLRARIELARSAETTEALASIDVRDPGGLLGFVMPERATPDDQVGLRFQSLAQVARRHLMASDEFGLKPEELPKHFVAATQASRFSRSYTDPDIYHTEVNSLLRLGFNTLVGVSADVVKETGMPYIGGAEYRPPAMDSETPEKDARDHYGASRASIIEDHGSLDRLRVFAMSDEPGWGLPQAPDLVEWTPTVIAGFHAYLREHAMTPGLLGRDNWDQVKPVGKPAGEAPLSEKRLWYHTVRYSGLDQTRRYAIAARALRAELGDTVLGFVNWNTPGIFYSDIRPWRSNAIYCSDDWFTFSRSRGNTCLWIGPGVSEDGDWYRSTFRMWSMTMNLLRSATDQGVGRFGAYVHHNFIPDNRGYEVALSIMAVAGHGGSGYNSYVWGPHYAFTEYMWSEKFGHYEHVADANRIIGRSEHLMIEARPPEPEVALLWPVTSMIYDLNTRGYWTYNRDHTVEMLHVWFALNHYNIPVEFVDETMIRQDRLKGRKVLYLTGANLERETAETIAQWVKGGGSLWTCAAAGTRDEYDQPMDLLDKVLGVEDRRISKEDIDYSPKGELRSSSPLGQIVMDEESGLGTQPWTAYGSRATFKTMRGEVVGRFEDDTPAVVRRRYGEGTSLHFATMPGLAYSRGATEADGLPTIDYPPRIANLITALPESLGIHKPAKTSLPFVEAAVLQSPTGMAVTLLNWSAEPVEELQVIMSDVPRLKSLRSARLGPLEHVYEGNRLSVTLPMPRVIDVLLVEFGQE